MASVLRIVLIALMMVGFIMAVTEGMLYTKPKVILIRSQI